MRTPCVLTVVRLVALSSLLAAAACAEPSREPPSASPSEAVTEHTSTESIEYSRPSRGIERWKIDKPVVTERRTQYPEIRYEPGDTILVSARGCVQIGGRGLTWKRYVDPRGPNAEKLYHALVEIPGVTAGLVRMQDVVDTRYVVRDVPGFDAGAPDTRPFVTLGYEDDFWIDNGYYDRDDGVENQCRSLKDASVSIVVEHRARHAVTPIAILSSAPETWSSLRTRPAPSPRRRRTR